MKKKKKNQSDRVLILDERQIKVVKLILFRKMPYASGRES